MDLTSLNEIYITGATAGIALVVLPLLVKAIQFIDSKMDSWSLNDTIGNDEYKISYFNIMALVLSFLVSVVVTIVAGASWMQCIAGGLLVYGTEYASGKLFWSKLITLLIHIKNKTFKFSDVSDVVDAALDDFKVTEDNTDDTTSDK